MDSVGKFLVNGSSTNINISLPDECPFCHMTIHPIAISSFENNDHTTQVILRCTSLKCMKIFVGYYDEKNKLISLSPGNKKPTEMSEVIKEVSPDFYNIYSDSYSAEQDNLLEICGTGYRKALEFLIKDYLIKHNKGKEKIIENTLLGKCINDYVKNENVKSVSKRAAWLGNDETHYVRKWEGKNLSDLKLLIELTVHWIEMEELTDKIKMEMPEKENQTKEDYEEKTPKS